MSNEPVMKDLFATFASNITLSIVQKPQQKIDLCHRPLPPLLKINWMRPNPTLERHASNLCRPSIITMKIEGQTAAKYALYPQGDAGVRHALEIWGEQEYEYSVSDLEDFDDGTQSSGSQVSAGHDGGGDDKGSGPETAGSETSYSGVTPRPPPSSEESTDSSRWTEACPLLDLNYDALKHIGTYYLPGGHGACTEISTIQRGAFHEIRVLHFEYAWSCICRFTREAEILAKAESELATMAYVKAHTTIPVPDAYFVNFNPDHVVGAPFVLMERMPGTTLTAQLQLATLRKARHSPTLTTSCPPSSKTTTSLTRRAQELPIRSPEPIHSTS